jgi:hypothetical protein
MTKLTYNYCQFSFPIAHREYADIPTLWRLNQLCYNFLARKTIHFVRALLLIDTENEDLRFYMVKPVIYVARRPKSRFTEIIFTFKVKITLYTTKWKLIRQNNITASDTSKVKVCKAIPVTARGDP